MNKKRPTGIVAEGPAKPTCTVRMEALKDARETSSFLMEELNTLMNYEAQLNDSGYQLIIDHVAEINGYLYQFAQENNVLEELRGDK